MPRSRNPENKCYPPRWHKRPSGIYYQVPKGTEKYWDGKKFFKLGKTDAEAYTEWAKRIDCKLEIFTVGDLLQRYYLQVTPQKSHDSIKSETRCYKELIKVFDKVSIHDVKPKDIYRYIDMRSAKVAARREKAMLSHAFTKAVEWGLVERHPFKEELLLEGEKARDRYVDDWEISAIMGMKNRRRGDVLEVIKAYINFKILVGMRQGNILRLTMSDIRENGIHFTPNKRGKPKIMKWSEELHKAVEWAKRVRPVDISPYLFCTRRGKKYTGNGFRSIWQRFMERLLKETEIKERFTEHDLRAKTGSDSPDDDEASERLTHQNKATTKRFYRRKPGEITPLR